MSSLKNKLYNYEQVPPAKVWEQIAAALDESHIADEFPSRLYNTEIAPPVSAWDKIAGALDNEDTKVIPLPAKRFPLFRYAAAAVVIGLVTVGILKWTGSNNNQDAESLATSPKTVSPVNDTAGLPAENASGKDSDVPGYVVPEEAVVPNPTIARVKTSPAKKIKPGFALANDIQPAEAIYAFNEESPKLADRYVMLMTPNGIIRMSKKLGNIVCCVTGEEQDEDCKDQIRKWQEKLAASPVAPAPGNFMDILSLLSSLDENDL